MAGNDHAILDLGDDNLQFTTNDFKAEGGSSQYHRPSPDLTQFPTPTTDRDTSQLIDDQEGGGPSDWKTSNFWTFAFYQQFFDVDTEDVRNRVMFSMVPNPSKSFLQYYIRPRPDLYGPFWICVTLVFSIAISGNMADFLQKSFQATEDHPIKWHYDFHKVSLSAMVVFSYASLLPAGLYGYMWWAGAGQVGSATISFVELLSLYGYSLTIYIPVSILWLIQYSWWQWICVLVGAGMSGVVLFTPLWPAVKHHASKSAAIVMVVIVSIHILLAVGFMLYFFHVPASSGLQPGTNVTEVVPEQNKILNNMTENNNVEPEKQPAIVNNSNLTEENHDKDNEPMKLEDDNDVPDVKPNDTVSNDSDNDSGNNSTEEKSPDTGVANDENNDKQKVEES